MHSKTTILTTAICSRIYLAYRPNMVNWSSDLLSCLFTLPFKAAPIIPLFSIALMLLNLVILFTCMMKNICHLWVLNLCSSSGMAICVRPYRRGLLCIPRPHLGELHPPLARFAVREIVPVPGAGNPGHTQGGTWGETRTALVIA